MRTLWTCGITVWAHGLTFDIKLSASGLEGTWTGDTSFHRVLNTQVSEYKLSLGGTQHSKSYRSNAWDGVRADVLGEERHCDSQLCQDVSSTDMPIYLCLPHLIFQLVLNS